MGSKMTDITTALETVQKNGKWLLDATLFERGKPQADHQAAYDRLLAALSTIEAELARAEDFRAWADDYKAQRDEAVVVLREIATELEWRNGHPVDAAKVASAAIEALREGARHDA